MSLYAELKQFTTSNQCFYKPKAHKGRLSDDEKFENAMMIYDIMDDDVEYSVDELAKVWSRSTTYHYLQRLIADGYVECIKTQQGRAYTARYIKTGK